MCAHRCAKSDTCSYIPKEDIISFHFLKKPQNFNFRISLTRPFENLAFLFNLHVATAFAEISETKPASLLDSLKVDHQAEIGLQGPIFQGPFLQALFDPIDPRGRVIIPAPKGSVQAVQLVVDLGLLHLFFPVTQMSMFEFGRYVSSDLC